MFVLNGVTASPKSQYSLSHHLLQNNAKRRKANSVLNTVPLSVKGNKMDSVVKRYLFPVVHACLMLLGISTPVATHRLSVSREAVL